MDDATSVAAAPTTDTSEAYRIAAVARAYRGEFLIDREMAAIWRMSLGTFRNHANRGEFDKFRVEPTVGRPLFRGTLVARHLTGQPLYEPTFGAKRGPR
jgi:hypothetical protein